MGEPGRNARQPQISHLRAGVVALPLEDREGQQLEHGVDLVRRVDPTPEFGRLEIDPEAGERDVVVLDERAERGDAVGIEAAAEQ